MKATKQPEPTKHFRQDFRVSRITPEHQNWIDSLIAGSEFNWRQAAYDTVERICRTHYCPKMPEKRIITNSKVRRVLV